MLNDGGACEEMKMDTPITYGVYWQPVKHCKRANTGLIPGAPAANSKNNHGYISIQTSSEAPFFASILASATTLQLYNRQLLGNMLRALHQRNMEGF